MSNSIELTVDAAELFAALKKAVSRRGTLMVTEYALLEAKGDQLMITTTDTKIQHSVSIPADVSEEGVICLEMLKVRTAVDGATGVARITASLAKAVIKIGRRNYSIPALGQEAFPLDELVNAEAVDINGTDLREALERVQYCAPTDNVRKYFNAVRVENNAAVACTGISIAVCSVSYTGKPFSIPSTSLKPANSMLKDESKVILGSDGSHVTRVMIDNGNESLIVRLTEDRYPDWQRAIHADHEWSIKFDSAELVAAIRRMTVFLSNFGDTKHKGVVLEASENSLKVIAVEGRSVRPEKGCEEIPAEINGNPVQVCMSAGPLMDAIGAVKSASAEWWGNAGSSAQKFLAAGRDDAHYLSPMKI